MTGRDLISGPETVCWLASCWGGAVPLPALGAPDRDGSAIVGASFDGVTGWGGGELAVTGAGFAFSAVGYRGAALELPGVAPWLIGAWGVLWAQALQTAVLGGWLAWRSPESLRAIARAWRVSLVAGLAGALASIGWFTAFALTTAANVRTLGMVEVVFSYLVSHRLMREKLARSEQRGLALVVAGLIALALGT